MAFVPEFSLQDENGWRLSIEHIDTYPCYLVIDNSTDKVVYEVPTAKDMEFLLGETTGYTYYLCSRNLKRILFFNSYDVLAVFNADTLKEADTDCV